MSSPLGWRAAGVLAAVPWLPFVSRYHLLLAFDALLFGAIDMSLDLLMGYAGLVSFGHAAFYGLGAYATAVVLELGGLSLWLCLAGTAGRGRVHAGRELLRYRPGAGSISRCSR